MCTRWCWTACLRGRRPGVLAFHPTRDLTLLDVEKGLATVEPRIPCWLDSGGLGDGDTDGSAADTWADGTPPSAELAAASVQGLVALARRPRSSSGRSERGGPGRPGGTAGAIERVCRYVLPPPVAQERLHVNDVGQVQLPLHHVARRDNARGVRPGRVPRAAGGARAATPHQCDPVLRRAGLSSFR
jgi:hypothetical protein